MKDEEKLKNVLQSRCPDLLEWMDLGELFEDDSTIREWIRIDRVLAENGLELEEFLLYWLSISARCHAEKLEGFMERYDLRRKLQRDYGMRLSTDDIYMLHLLLFEQNISVCCKLPEKAYFEYCLESDIPIPYEQFRQQNGITEEPEQRRLRLIREQLSRREEAVTPVIDGKGNKAFVATFQETVYDTRTKRPLARFSIGDHEFLRKTSAESYDAAIRYIIRKIIEDESPQVSSGDLFVCGNRIAYTIHSSESEKDVQQRIVIEVNLFTREGASILFKSNSDRSA